ncbi:MAG TPA: glycoside hydrolase family 2 TIM barrel-domain containing protein [Tepidisphaeraceae bacterium]|nr:glycoside hydrolase family 2 TIM barrel-domain containing protein [Tepidisphaeraceae bacterium]
MQLLSIFIVAALGFTTMCGAADWKQADGPLKTRWAKEVTPQSALPEYPRPQLVRKNWQNLNGLWQFAAATEGEKPPVGKDLAEQILVPYPQESALSGIMRHEDHAWYRRMFEVPSGWEGKNILLHFDAVNWDATVYLNGKRLGQHKGGYDAFGFNITKHLKKTGPQELILEVLNTPDKGNHARGKQTMRPGGIFYTPASGIWQTVWMEPLEPTFIENVQAVPDVDKGMVVVTAQVLGKQRKSKVKVEITTGGKKITGATGSAGKPIKLKIADAHLWSPEDPFLYDMTVSLDGTADAPGDSVQSYFGMRKIALARDDQGILRPMLNNKFVFQVGPLDQGYWPDGIYTAPTDAALKYDIEIEKKLGFNTIRKHVKVEPERWYYWCDKLGMLVWQDMPSMRDTPENDAKREVAGQLKKLKDEEAKGTLTADQSAAESQRINTARGRMVLQERDQFERELDRLLQGRGNHPCIIQWVVFNEGWGQYDTDRLTAHVKEIDPTRLVDNASGWFDQKVGDVIDMHHYPDPAMPKPEESRAAVLGEFGGLGLPLEGHTWQKTGKNWGYRKITNPDELTAGYERMLAKAWTLKGKGLCAVIYTQTTDVETECNGLLTYDREVVKPNVDRLHAVNTGHIENIPQPHVVVPSAQQDKAIVWRYTTDAPPDGWNKAGFDDSAWKQGPGGFGTARTPGAIIGTTWNTNNIWLRRSFDLPPGTLKDPQLILHHDDDAEVYLNGVLATSQKAYIGEYETFPIAREALATLKPGKNLLAIHCLQHTGGQYIDAGILEMK